MADGGANARITFLNRLLSGSDGWVDASALVADFRAAFGARAAGLRWPAEGPAVLIAETARVSDPEVRLPFEPPDQLAGLFWADGVPGELETLKLAANALGRSPAWQRFLGPIGDQARTAQRLTDAAQVAGRVAHDLDNVFQGVNGFIALTLELLEPGSMAHQNLVEADNAARHGMKFCGQLHQLSRGGQAKPMPAGLASAVNREVARVAKAHPRLKFETDVSGELPPVAMESGCLQLLLGHLLDNAAEASANGGLVQVSARMAEPSAAELLGYLGNPAPGPNVVLNIRDDGPGVSEVDRRRMFVEPFFTTKVRHRGLGLAVVYRMLYAHRGGVQVDGAPGQGTTLRVVLPLALRPTATGPGRTTGGFP